MCHVDRLFLSRVFFVLKHFDSNRSNRSSISMDWSSPSKSKSASRRRKLDSWCCSGVRNGLSRAFIAPLQARHSICFSSGPHLECREKCEFGRIRPQVLHCFQKACAFSATVLKNPRQKFSAAGVSGSVAVLSQLPNGNSDELLWTNPQFSQVSFTSSNSASIDGSSCPWSTWFISLHFTHTKVSHAL